MKSEDIAQILSGRDPRTMVAETPCLTHTEIAAFADGVVDQSDQLRFEDHLSACPQCAGIACVVISSADIDAQRTTPDTTMARARKLFANRQTPIRRFAPWAAAAAVLVFLLAVQDPFGMREEVTGDVGDRSVRTLSAQLQAPQLITPQAGALVQSDGLEVRWAELPGSLFYDVHVVTESGHLVRRERVTGTRWKACGTSFASTHFSPIPRPSVPNTCHSRSIRSDMRNGAQQLLIGVVAWISAGFVLADEPPLPAELEAAVALYREQGAQAALPEFQRLSAQYSSGGDRISETTAVRFVGESHWRLGNFPESESALNRALGMAREIGARQQEADVLNVLGLLAWDLGNYQNAIDRFQDSRSIAASLGDAVGEGMTLNNLSLVYDDLGDYEMSLALYEEVLTMYSKVDFPRGEGDTLGNIGGVHLLLGDYAQALEYYKQALVISEQLASVPSMSQDHGNLALCYLGLGDVDTAISQFDRAIELARSAGMRQDEAYWLNGRGAARIRQGRYQLGLQDHRTALSIYEDVGARGELLESHHELGQTYLLLGDVSSAESQFERAMSLARETGLARGITENLLALGDLSFHRQQYEEAVASYDEARARAEANGEKNILAISGLRLALALREQGKVEAAMVQASAALDTASSIGARLLEAEAHYAMGELSRRSGDFEAALAAFGQALSTLGSVNDPELLWQVHFGRGLAHESNGDARAAVSELIAAVEVIEGIRNQLQEDRFRASYVQDKHDVYIELVRLQLELGLETDAFSTAERLRYHSYSALADRGPRPALTPAQQRRESELRERIRQLQRSLAEEQRADPAEQRQIAVDNFSRALMLAEQDYQVFLDDHAGSRPGSATGAELPTSPSVRGQLSQGEALVEYVVGPNLVMAFVLSPDSMQVKVSAARRQDVESQVRLLRDLIRHPDDEGWKKPALALAELLVDPLLESGLLAGVDHLFLVPHGVLNYLPFALLPVKLNEGEPLLSQYRLAYLPTAGLLDHDAPGVRGGGLLALAPTRSRLRFAPDEARSIGEFFEPHSKLLIGDEATESRFKSMAGDYRVLHLATHGYFNKLNPLLSGVELEPDPSNDGLLEVHEVLGLQLDAALVTLSACDTGMGSGFFAEVPAGDEFIGLTRAFLSAGSDSVMATLWEVDDRSSVRLMQEFYERASVTQSGWEVADALSRAQLDLLNSNQFSHPYYWAPFVLVGTPRPVNQRPSLTMGVSS